MKTKYVFPKQNRLKRHHFNLRFNSWIVGCKCGVQLWIMDCHRVTSNPKAHPNEPCKRCEAK